MRGEERMSNEESKQDKAPPFDIESIEERRAALNLKTWLVKTTTLTVMSVFIASVLALIYSVIIQGKELDAGFIGEILKDTFEFLRMVMA